MNGKVICPVCRGTGILDYRISATDLRRRACWRCEGPGFLDVADISDQEEDEVMALGIRPTLGVDGFHLVRGLSDMIDDLEGGLDNA